jgi:hypothetical protein
MSDKRREPPSKKPKNGQASGIAIIETRSMSGGENQGAIIPRFLGARSCPQTRSAQGSGLRQYARPAGGNRLSAR